MDELREEQEAYKRERDTLDRRGVKRRDPPVAKQPVPYDPENLHIPYAQFVEKRRKQKERAAKLAAYEDELDKEEASPETPAKVENKTEVSHQPPEEHTLQKPRGRPKKNVA